jgi:hypothetical protein
MHKKHERVASFPTLVTKEEWIARELAKAPELKPEDVEWVRQRFRLDADD